jgi:hypothetical protein
VTKELDVASRQRTVSRPFSLKMKPKGCHFYTIEVIETESQAVLNILTEHNLHDALRKRQKRWKRCIPVEGD